MTDVYGKTLSDYVPVSKQTLSVKTLQDFVAFQTALIEKTEDNFTTVAHL
ncbi:hypothetical protein [Asticcacaulis sp. AC402]|nr:hypothetical protein [Asticcacaulis sp. AC402]ESQ77229.1 hypothetical protein ABAC402_02160 [Asticcacaulis sp. AC402]